MYAPLPADAWYFEPNGGWQSMMEKDETAWAWAVRPGDIAPIPEADIWGMLLAGLGLLAVYTRRRR